MEPTLRQIRALITVARLGSFTRATSTLHISQPALTVQIRTLEQALGAKLLNRTSRGVVLTRLGQELMPQLQRTVGDIDALLHDARELGAGRLGTVSIAALPSFAASFLPDLIERFRSREPRLRFVVHDAVASAVNAHVRSEAVDIGITGGKVHDAELEVLEKASDRLCVVYPKDHALAARRRIGVRDLVDLPMVLMAPSTSVRAVVDAAFARLGCFPAVSCEPIYMMTAVAMVRAGLGVTVLPGNVREILAEPSIRSSPINDASFVRPIALIRKRNRTLSPATQAFVDECAKAMRVIGTRPRRGR